MNQQQSFGYNAEAFVVSFLQKRNFVILEQNYKKFYGEIDIIAQKDDFIVFVEVKARRNTYVSLFSLVSPSKQRKIMQVAHEYIMRNASKQITYRFDVALLQSDATNGLQLSYIANAFC